MVIQATVTTPARPIHFKVRPSLYAIPAQANRGRRLASGTGGPGYCCISHVKNTSRLSYARESGVQPVVLRCLNSTAGELAFHFSALSSTPTRLTSKWGNTRLGALQGRSKPRTAAKRAKNIMDARSESLLGDAPNSRDGGAVPGLPRLVHTK